MPRWRTLSRSAWRYELKHCIVALVDFFSNGATAHNAVGLSSDTNLNESKLFLIKSISYFFRTPCILDMQKDGIRNIPRYSTTHWTKRRSMSQRLTIQVSTMVDRSGVLLGEFCPSSLASPLPCSSRYHLSSPFYETNITSTILIFLRCLRSSLISLPTRSTLCWAGP